MLVCLSPYHLTTREPVALAALLLADRVVTLVPAPEAGRAAARAAAEQVPRYLDLMLSWQWSVPLWKEGVICSAIEGEDAAHDVREAFDRIAADDRYASLRSLMKPGVFEAEDAYLEAVARDVLKAGPDPGITVPVAAGMDRFALRHGAAVARSQPSSVVQKAEERLGTRVFAFVAPVLLQASAERLLEARAILEPELAALRRAVDAQSEGGSGEAGRALSMAAGEYARAFERERAELVAPEADDAARVIDGAVAITGLLLPEDAVLTSSLAALRAMSPGTARGRGETQVEAAAEQGSLARRRGLSLLVRVLGRSAAR
jgi:hypothetical protein